MRTLLLVLLTLLAGSEAWLHWGRCPDPTPKYDWDLINKWYLRSGYNSYPLIPGSGRCGYAEYNNNFSGTIEVKFAYFSSWWNRWEDVNGTLTLDEPSDNSKMILKIPKRWGFWDETMPYWILYVTNGRPDPYMVVYSCENVLFNFHHYSVQVLSLNPNTDLSGIDDVLTSFNLDSIKFVTYDQTNCTHH
ncbi:apolipoprotein D-like [Macrosteles quadrilineatus]|uniref:apolipoprotein D-like n=1 Tax=Macrosteles quadrilineatus TaxID=74068 RepID=UPI0023E138EC|nr:apolipoprotein D-like [Macrosteles quadrilineatus]